MELHDLAFADSNDVAALTAYCRDMTTRGGHISVCTSRPALRRLLMASPVAEFVDTDDGDESGPEEPYTCPHRLS